MTAEEPQVFVERIIKEAAGRGASDLYLIPAGAGMVVRCRVDGVQQDLETVPLEFGERCVSRLKVLAGLLTYRTRVSQDGAIHDIAMGDETELRLSVMPTSHGERASIRLLQGMAGPRLLDELGFDDQITTMMRDFLASPTGMIVLTGPTGCGKTTTIYALIRELLALQQDPASIITIEDPIECEIDGISQVSVGNEPGWGYAQALRASLRQDVKTIVVGEMRDRDVVGVTLDAALSGHRVITTYHAGDIPSVYARLLHHGFEPFLVASAITGVVTQRLVPQADGQGRVPIVAALRPDDKWRDFIASGPSLAELRKHLDGHLTADLQASADRLIKSGTIPSSTRL